MHWLFFLSMRALVFRVRICASMLAKVFMAELGKRVKVETSCWI